MLVTSVPRPNRQSVTLDLLFSQGNNQQNSAIHFPFNFYIYILNFLFYLREKYMHCLDGNTGNQRELLQRVLISPLLPVLTLLTKSVHFFSKFTYYHL